MCAILLLYPVITSATLFLPPQYQHQAQPLSYHLPSRHLLNQFHYHTKSACVGQMQAAHLILAGVQPMKVLIKPQGCYLWKGSGQGTPNLPVPLRTLRLVVCATVC